MASKRIKTHIFLIAIAIGVTLLTGVVMITRPRIRPSDLTGSEKTQAAEINTLSNSSFENSGSPIANWNLNVNSAQATLSQDSSTKVDGNVSAKINITSAGSNASVQFYQTASITSGKQYTIKFSAKASSSRSIDFKLDKLNTSNNHFEHAVSLTSSWQQFSYQFTAAESDSSERYEFNVGGATGQVWIDNATFNVIENTPTPSPTRSPTPTPTRSPTPIPTPTPTPVRTPSPVVTTPVPNTPTPNTPSPNTTTQPTQPAGGPPATNNPTPQPTNNQSTSNPDPTNSNTDTTTADNSNANEEPAVPAYIPGLTVNQTNVVQTLDRSTTANKKITGPGFTVTSTGATLWNIKYISAPSGVGFEPTTGIIRSGQTSTIKSVIQSSKLNGTYRGQAVIEYFDQGAWHTGSEINFTLTLTGTSLANITNTIPNTIIASPSPDTTTGAANILALNNPTKDSRFLSGNMLPIKWDIHTRTSPVTTAILLQKESGAIVNTIEDNFSSRQGANTYSWKIPQVLPGDYKLSLATNQDLATTSDPFTIGSRIIIYAAGTQFNNIYPTMQLSINNKQVKTYYGVQGDIPNRQFMEYYYYAPTRIQPDTVKITFPNDEYRNSLFDRNLIIDKINIDGTDYETESADVTTQTGNTACESGNVQTEWLLCTGSFTY